MSVRQIKTRPLGHLKFLNFLDDFSSNEENQSTDVVIEPLNTKDLANQKDFNDELFYDLKVNAVVGSLEMHVATSSSENLELKLENKASYFYLLKMRSGIKKNLVMKIKNGSIKNLIGHKFVE